MAPAKKLLIVNNIPTPYRAFMFNTLFEVGKQFDVDVSVVFQAQREQRRFWKPEEMVMRFPHTYGRRSLWKRGTAVELYTPRTLNWDIVQQIRSGEYDYVLMGGLMSVTQWMASFIPAGKTLKLLWSESNLQSTRRTAGPAKWLKSAIFGRYDALACPGERAVEYIRFFNSEASKKPVLWLPNIVDNSNFAEKFRENRVNSESIRREMGIAADECLFLAIGRHVDYKGFGHLIEAFREIQGRYRLIILGDGPMRGPWQQRVQELGLSGQIALPGNVGEQEVVRHMAVADWFIHPALEDPSPLVMIEATTAGLPVAASWHVGNVPETIKHEHNGFIFDSTDHAGLVTTIKKMLKMPADERRTMGQRSAELAHGKFDPVLVSERFFRDMLALTTGSPQ